MLRWTDTCILVSSCIEVSRKGNLKLTLVNPVNLFGALSSVDPRAPMSHLFLLLRNESCICFFRSSYPHSYREFSVFLSFSFVHVNVASSSYSVELLAAFCRFSHPLLISYPLSCVSSFTSRSRVKPSATTGSADEKEISLSFLILSLSSSTMYPSFSLFSIARLCVVLRRNNVAAEPSQSSFLNLSWDNRLGVII